MTTLDALRAPLFVPADRPDLLQKAIRSGADAVIIDLEDAVAADARTAARALLPSAPAGVPLLLRINGVGTPWYPGDLLAARNPPFAAIVLPKAESAPTVAAVSAASGGLPVIALIETARGLAAARQIAAATGVVRLAFGSIDYCADIGCAHEREALLHARCELVLASRLAGLCAPLDGVTLAFRDRAQLQADVAHARSLGMRGKLCIHPAQLADVRAGFVPTREEIDLARKILSRADGAIAIDGQMVDEPVRRLAEQTLVAAKQGGLCP